MTSMRRRVAFVINSIGMGGAERVLDLILQGAGKGSEEIETHLILLDDEPIMRKMAPVTSTHVLDSRGGLVRSVKQLQSLLDDLEPDLVVSFLIRANVSAAVWRWRGGNAPVVLCERMHATSHLHGRYNPVVAGIIRLAMRFAYRRADKILAVSNGVRNDLVENFSLDPGKIELVPNPYDPAQIEAETAMPAGMALPTRFAAASGRLVKAKNFSLLLQAYASASPDLDLVILGNGPERAALAKQAADLGLEGRVHLPGYIANPYPIVARSEFFVSSSRNEGFPNAIAEAMALARPIIATDCPSGPAELLKASAATPGKVVKAPYGLIVPNDDCAALAEAIRMMTDSKLRDELGAAGRSRIDDFLLDDVVSMYWREFERQMTD